MGTYVSYVTFIDRRFTFDRVPNAKLTDNIKLLFCKETNWKTDKTILRSFYD